MPLEQERQWIASLRKTGKSILLLGFCEDEAFQCGLRQRL